MLDGGGLRLSLGRAEVSYPGAGEPARVVVGGREVPVVGALPAGDGAVPVVRTGGGTVSALPAGDGVFALAAGADGVVVSDRAARLALLVPRHCPPAGPARPLVWAAGADPRRAGCFRVTVHGADGTAGAPDAVPAGVLYVAQAFGHTTGWVPAVHAALTALPRPLGFTAAVPRREDALHAQRTSGSPERLRVVPLRYDDSATATITPDDVANPSRPWLLNREAALLWVADNLPLARVALGAAAIVNDCRPETWMLHQLAEYTQGRAVALHTVRYAFEEFPQLRQLAARAEVSRPRGPVAEVLEASAAALHTRRELLDALRASGTDLRRTPSADFEGASRDIMARVPADGTIWYQAVDWRERLALESGALPYVVVPPLGRASALPPDEAARVAGSVLARRWPALRSVFSELDDRSVALVSQGNGFSAHSRRHWAGVLALAARVPQTHFLLAGGSREDRAWLAGELAAGPRANVTLLGWVNEHWTTLLRALRAKPRTVFLCRPGLSSIGAALANGVPPLLMPPDPLVGPDGGTDPVTAEVAMERALYAFQLERLYADRCARHTDSPLPVLVDTLGGDTERAAAALRRALEPDVQLRRLAAIDGYCRWSRVADLIAGTLAREAAAGPLTALEKRRVRDRELLPVQPPSEVRS
ncbi:hypothetical protein AB0910_28645 [Streptomyces sp. NPDC047002]|uniref:hypothetical protein n=1 Tax=Streptomyces sp. NPDC047002 TaxID=3155475 RepID=UPI0034555F51